jgi:DnaK suppressor protein
LSLGATISGLTVKGGDSDEVEVSMPRQNALLRLYRQLLAQRAELQRQLALDISHAGDSGSVMGDSADMANDDVERELSSQLASLESRELEQTEAAILALQQGRYGTCEECHNPIPIARLQALPHSTTCIGCQRSEERGGRKQGSRTNWTTAWRDEVRALDVATTLENLSIPLDR